MLYDKKYTSTSQFGSVVYFNERLSPKIIGGDYLECGKNYLRADYPQIVADLFPYNIKEHAKDYFSVMNTYHRPPFHCTGTEGGGGGSPPGFVFDANPSTSWVVPGIQHSLTFEIDPPLSYTISHGKCIHDSRITNIRLRFYYSKLNGEFVTTNIHNPISNTIYEFENLGFLQQLYGFNKIILTVLASSYGYPGISALNLYTVPGSDIENNVIKGFTVPDAPLKPGYKAYVNIDYRGIEAKHRL